MTDPEITALAREYAERECNKSTMIDTSNLYEDKLLEFYDVYGFLLRRFYLVEKSKLGKDGLDIAWRAKEYDTVILSSDNVYYLFPEIAKEVEE